MTLFGVLWAVLAPVVPIAVALAVGALVGRALRLREHVQPPIQRWLIQAVLGGVTVFLLMAPVGYRDRQLFDEGCREAVLRDSGQRALVDGIYLNDSTANSFGMRYLHEEGFVWFEARDIYHPGQFVRYERDAQGVIHTVPIEALTARFEVRAESLSPNPYTHLLMTSIVDRSTGTQWARAGLGHFDGGRLRYLLGAWFTASCPSPVTDSDAWQTHYHLAKRVLRAEVAR